MTTPHVSRDKVLYVVTCAAPPAQYIQEFIPLAQAAQWDVCVIATPYATRFIDSPLLESLSEHPVRSDYKRPGESDALPKADAIVVVPATFNTINKWLLGIADTLATGILCEALGRGTPPIVAVPCLKVDLARHPAFSKNIALLREYGVQVLHDPERYPSPKIVPWETILDALNQIVKKAAPPELP